MLSGAFKQKRDRSLVMRVALLAASMLAQFVALLRTPT
jgi:hypothetical protein